MKERGKESTTKGHSKQAIPERQLETPIRTQNPPMIDQIMYIYMAGEHIKWVYIYTKKLAPDVGEVLMTYI